MTTVFMLDANGVFSHSVVIADPYAVIPRGASTPPPETTGTQVAYWSDNAWSVLPEYPKPSVEETKAALKEQATNLRWQHEAGGVTLPGDIQISTTTHDQNRITTVIANAQLAGVTSVDFRAASGWVTLTISEIQNIAAAIALHVQACFSAERAHHEAIDALETLEQARAYDVATGWPQ